MNKKIKQYSALAIATAAIIPLACKKDAVEFDDPNVNFVDINLTLSYAAGDRDTSLDLFGVISGFDLRAVSNSGVDYLYFDVDSYLEVENDDERTVNGYIWDFLRARDKNSNMDTSSAVWSESNDDGYLFVNDKNPLPGASSGFHGQGDKYFVFRNPVGPGNYIYGWICINVAADGKSMTIKNAAYSTLTNVPFKVGTK